MPAKGSAKFGVGDLVRARYSNERTPRTFEVLDVQNDQINTQHAGWRPTYEYMKVGYAKSRVQRARKQIAHFERLIVRLSGCLDTQRHVS